MSAAARDDPATRAARAKAPVTALAGPYGHPFHPILVPIPIGAWIGSLVLDVASRSDGNEALGEAAVWLIGLGVLGAVAAASVGFLDLFAIPTGTKAFRTALVHGGINLVVTTAFVVLFLLRQDQLDEGTATETSHIAASVVAIALLAASGWLGGRLAYRYGVRVADDAVQTDGF